MSTIDTPLIVLGMHRSGTSLLSGTLHALGVFLGEEKKLMAAQKDVNAKGFWEYEPVVAIHDEILRVLDSHWSQVARLPEGWQNDPRIASHRESLINLVCTEFTGQGLWGLKDPRMCRLLPLWNSIFEQLAIKPKFILISRHPFEVAASLTKRDGNLSFQYSLFLWLVHVLEAEEFSNGFDRTWLTYEELNQNWQKAITKAGNDLCINWPLLPDSECVKNTMKELVTDGLWHNRSDTLVEENDDVLGCTLELYAVLTQLAQEHTGNENSLYRIQIVREKLLPFITLINQATKPLFEKCTQKFNALSDLQTENSLLVKQREEHAALNEALQKENELLVQQREEHAALNEALQKENELLVQQRDELYNRLNSGMLGVLNRLQK